HTPEQDQDDPLIRGGQRRYAKEKDRRQDQGATKVVEDRQPSGRGLAQDPQANHHARISHSTGQGNADNQQLGILASSPDNHGDSQQADGQRQGAAAVGGFSQPPDTGQVHPHGSRVLQQD